MLYNPTALEESFLDYVRHNVKLHAGGEYDCQWSHDVSGTVTARVEDPQQAQRGAVATDQMQIRAAEAVLALLERHEHAPNTPEAQKALSLSANSLRLLNVPMAPLPDVVQELRGTKIPALHAWLTHKSGRRLLEEQYADLAPTLREDGVKSLGQQLGNTRWQADQDAWLAEAKAARQAGDPAAEAQALRKLQWLNQRRAADFDKLDTGGNDYREAAEVYARDAAVAEQSAATQRQEAAEAEATDRGRVRAAQLLVILKPWVRRIVHETLGDLL